MDWAEKRIAEEGKRWNIYLSSAQKQFIAGLLRRERARIDRVKDELVVIRDLHKGLMSCCDCGKRAERALKAIEEGK